MTTVAANETNGANETNDPASATSGVAASALSAGAAPAGGTADVIVVGGGITGLTVAWHLKRAGVEVVLLEASAAVGGSIRTEHRRAPLLSSSAAGVPLRLSSAGGETAPLGDDTAQEQWHGGEFLLEKGPFNVIIRAPEFEALLDGLADRVQVVTASRAARHRYIYRGGRLRRVPNGPLGLFTSGLLSFGGACRALRGLFLSARGRESEPTLEEFAVRRFGREVADTLLSAAIAGILAGDISRLSAYAAFPVLEEFDRHSISPLGRTLRRMPNMLAKMLGLAPRRRWKGLVSLDRGLGGLCTALADELGPGLRREQRVTALQRTADGYVLDVQTPHGVQRLHARRVVLATPARETSRLLAPLAPAAADVLARVESASLTVINLAFRRADVAHPLDGFGFLVPRNEPAFPLMGVLWASSAFPHHAPPGVCLLRVFMGGTRTPDIVQRDPAEVVRVARAALADTLGVTGEPLLIDVCPYPDAIPQYMLGHRERMATVQAAVGALPGLHVAGNYLEGVSINDCVKLGTKVAAELSGAGLRAR